MSVQKRLQKIKQYLTNKTKKTNMFIKRLQDL